MQDEAMDSLHAALDELFLHHRGHEGDLQQLTRYINARPEMALIRPLLFADEVDERLEVADSFFVRIRESSEADAELTAMTLAVAAFFSFSSDQSDFPLFNKIADKITHSWSHSD